MSNKKEALPDSTSISTLNHCSEHPEATKKAISTEQICLESNPTDFERESLHYHVVLPFQIEIKSLLKHLRMKLEEQDINILFYDELAGQILVQKQPNQSKWLRMLDCFCVFRKEGWPKGSMFQTCEVVSFTIKRQYIEQKCLLGVKANFSRAKASTNLNKFIDELLNEVKKILESYKGFEERFEINQINPESPLALEMNAYRKVYGILSHEANDLRYKALYDISLKKLNDDMAFMEQQQGNKKIKISDIVEKLVKQSESLFNFIIFSNNNIVQGSHSQYIQYAVENMFCYNFFPKIFELYRRNMAENCEQFRKNSEFINKNVSDKQYFDYLEVRPRFRLQNSDKPYDLAIDALRKLETALTLREILLCVQKTFSLIKVCCLYEHQGKLEIASMDDILPVMIYVVAKAQVQNFPVFVKIIDDYVRIRGVFELEERVTTTLYVATEDITKKLPTGFKNQ